MRSLAYILSGKPKNGDDWQAMAAKGARNARLRIKNVEHWGENDYLISTELEVTVDQNRTFNYHLYGRSSFEEPQKELAEKRLQRIIEEIESSGILIENITEYQRG